MKLRLLGLACLVVGCASPTPPPGGPDDFVPPVVVAVSPDSGQTKIVPEYVEFRFDGIIAEPSRGGSSGATVSISPRDGDPVVRWRRDRLEVRPKEGWRENTTYVVTLQPGIRDLAGNVRDTATVLVFATGASIPDTRVTGVVFDWTVAQSVAQAIVEARPANDSTLVFATKTDSLGRFVLPFLTPGSYRLTALLDGNRNGLLDPREKWDSATVALRDTARIEFYSFAQDSFPTRLTTVTARDSLTLRLSFDRPLAPDFDVARAVQLLRADSTALPIAHIGAWEPSLKARAARQELLQESATRALAATDTTNVGVAARARLATMDSLRTSQRADSIARAAAAPPSIPRPASRRPALVTDLMVELRTPLTPGERYTLRAEVVGINGRSSVSERPYTAPRESAERPPMPNPPSRPQPPRP